jgi:methylenetetrahydrofolate dehydrogenase (NADP+)/methenyltetrahydrofolate cyclohydrolase
MQILDGKALSDQIKIELKKESDKLNEKGITPGLAVILVGDDAASQTYVKMKEKACDTAGIYSIIHKMPTTISQEKILETISMINNNPNIDGVLVQLPLPKHIDTTKIIEAIDPKKDVDGFHPQNVGALVVGKKGFVSCTPAGIIQLLKRINIEIAGKHCVVIGRSNIVGKPMALLMLRENATVTICHSRTENLKEICKEADILIVAIGKPRYIGADYIKEGAVVIDVGIHRNEENKLCGDVRFEEAEQIASYITPVPGGVGPMTIAMLMHNCVDAMKLYS